MLSSATMGKVDRSWGLGMGGKAVEDLLYTAFKCWQHCGAAAAAGCRREIGPVENIGRGEHVSEQIPVIAFSTWEAWFLIA